MLTSVLLGLAAIVVVFLIVVALRSPDFRIVRSTSVAASPSAVFDQVNDLHRYQAWNPFSKLDPNARYSFSGPSGGVGASLAYSGNKQIGAGKMTITESRPGELVRYRLEFLQPFETTNMAEFTFRPQGAHTVVEWSMAGKYNFMFKAMSLLINSDRMIGGMFEQGLANLKAAAESSAR